ncbi:MAG: class I SAM-dependent DNA methyltransferase [Campylobacteraceae bacterium]|nr:class I SAM-dependent DNA methyltransferase [Campylobacteraceae bacterium]
MSLNTISNIGVNIQEKATVIWNVADMLRGPFKPHEYGLVILPMTVVKRFNDCLMPTYNEVQKAYQNVKHLAVIDGFLTTASGYQFYNISKFTFDSLLADPQNIEANFRDYLAGFSSNIQDILAKFDFDSIIKRMVESNTLYLVIREFNTPKGYLGPDKISAVDCGYIFEDLVKRFSESYGEEAGAHFTSRDIIYLMTDILLNEADLATEGNITVYDMTMGTSQMLSCMEERIHAINKNIEVTCFGQEFNPSTFAIAKADMMIRGGDPNNMRFGDTLSDDQFSGYTFKYCISNPPFGIDWKREQKAVEAEAKLGENGRFGAGLPKISDGQQLFVLNGISKLAPDGKMAIIQNGSPLFSGDAGSGPSNIRQYILENDWLDAIIQLSTDQFMNTGISTYIWVISKDKPSYKAGKVQLIDASHCYKPRRKSIGNKKNDITDACRELIIQAYGEFKNNAIYGDKSGVYCESKIFDTVKFGYNKIVVERPLRDENGKIVKKAGKPVADTSLRDTENVPLDEDIDRYFKREILPYAMDAWIDKKKTKVGYEIPMTRYFYEYKAPEPVGSIVKRINKLEADIATSLKALFDRESNQ